MAVSKENKVVRGEDLARVGKLIKDKYATKEEAAGIKPLIPAQASPENQLADKAFVNSSISTATATFRGTFTDKSELEGAQADDNDYAFHVRTDEAGNTVYDRYKYNGEAWVFEYALNNSSFTAEQWAAIQSGITRELANRLRRISDAPVQAVTSLTPSTRDNEYFVRDAGDADGYAWLNTTQVMSLFDPGLHPTWHFGLGKDEDGEGDTLIIDGSNGYAPTYELKKVATDTFRMQYGGTSAGETSELGRAIASIGMRVIVPQTTYTTTTAGVAGMSANDNG